MHPNFARLRSLILLLLLTGSPAMAWADAPYWVLFQNGEQLSGKSMHFWHGGKQTTLDDLVLFDQDDPPRVIRRTGNTVRLSGPYVEFTNGDLLPGRVTSFRKAAAVDAPATFAVALTNDSAIVPSESSELRVRAEQARVIVWGTRRRLLDYEPGTVLFRDGRRVDCRNLRISGDSITLLAEQGVMEASFSELSELHLPDRPWNAAEMQLRWLKWADANMLLESLVLTNGARLTFPQGMSEMQTHYRSELFARCAVQPLWSLDMLYFDPEQAAVSIYRRLTEVPLSLLPVSTLRHEATFHAWSPQRDRNLHGQLLASGSIAVSEGFSVHGNTSLAIDLPPSAVSFSGWVGIDRSAGQHGAMRCEIRANEAAGSLLWQSELLRGGSEPQRIEPVPVANLKRLLLVADEAAYEQANPPVDPFDIGDDLSWLLATVTLAPPGSAPDEPEAAAPETVSPESVAPETVDVTPENLTDHRLDDWIPELAGWSVAVDSAPVQLRPIWNPKEERWRYSVGLRNPDAKNRRILLHRPVKVSLANAYLKLSAASHVLHAGHELSVWAGEEKIGSTINQDPKTSHQVGNFSKRTYILGDYAGREIDLRLSIEPSDPRPPGSGVFFESAELSSLLLDLPADNTPYEPTVSLVDLQPLESKAEGQPWEPRTDCMVTDRLPLNIRGYELERGIAVPVESEITYRLEPQWTRFVAAVGLANGWQGAGPFEVLIDGQQAYITTDPSVFKRSSPGQQINVPIPAGSETITLKVGGRSSTGAWAEAGFIGE